MRRDMLRSPAGWTCHRLGTGPPLVIQAPGWGCGGRLYRTTLEALSSHCQVLSIDPRGSGEWPSEQSVSVASHTEDLAALVDALGLDRFHLLGHSHGGWIALRYATQHPERLNGLTLIGPEIEHIAGFEAAQRKHIQQAPQAGPLGRARAQYLRSFQNGFSDIQGDAQLTRWFQTVLPFFAHDLPAILPWFEDMPDIRLNAYRSCMATNHHYPVLPMLHRVQCPVLLMTGASEWPGFQLLAQRLLEALANARHTEVPQAGHFPWLEQPDTCLQVISAFLQETCRQPI